MNIPANVGFADAIWEYRVCTNEVFYHFDSITPECCGRWMPYDAIERQYQENRIFAPDLEIWGHSLTAGALQHFAGGERQNKRFYIRFCSGEKKAVWHEIALQKAGEDRLFLSIRKVPGLQQICAIASAAIPELDYVCRIDVSDGSYVLYSFAGNRETAFPGKAGNYEQNMRRFHQLYALPGEADSLTGQMCLEQVQRELERDGEYILYTTMRDEDGLSYKKLRFCYEDEEKSCILLSRTDVSAMIGGKELSEHTLAKQLAYLDNMPVAFCSIKVLLDDEGKPYDFQFTYCNHAHEKLENTDAGELLGKNFYEYFENTDPKWLKYYYETAYQGIPHIIRSYSPEIQKYLCIYTFRSEYGHCECVLLDESEQHFLIQELEHSRETMKNILEITTVQVFQYLPERGEVIFESRENSAQRVVSEETLYQRLGENELLHPGSQEVLKRGFQKMKEGDHTTSMIVQSRNNRDMPWEWLRVTMFDFQDKYAHERKIFGFMQNIDEFKAREEELRRKAELDSLTRVLNSGTGKLRISRRLENRLDTEQSYYIMFVMDLDNFKSVNDTHGHMAGDKALVDFSRILRRIFRGEDIIYRLGGDEFVVFVDKSPDAEQSVCAMMQRLMDHVERAQAESPFLGCSVGAFVSNRPHSFEECYQMADQALYKVKHSGKGRFHIEFDVQEYEE